MLLVPPPPLAKVPVHPYETSARGITTTPELRAIVDTDLDAGSLMKIIAVAGAGKSTALLEYAARRPLLQTAFVTSNKTVQVERSRRSSRPPAWRTCAS